MPLILLFTLWKPISVSLTKIYKSSSGKGKESRSFDFLLISFPERPPYRLSWLSFPAEGKAFSNPKYDPTVDAIGPTQSGDSLAFQEYLLVTHENVTDVIAMSVCGFRCKNCGCVLWYRNCGGLFETEKNWKRCTFKIERDIGAFMGVKFCGFEAFFFS